MSNYHNPIPPPARLSDIFEEVRRVSSKDVPEGRRHSHDPHALGPGWFHLTALDVSGIEPSGHVNGHWETNYCKPHVGVLDAIAGSVFMPPTGFEMIRLPDGRVRLTATGAHHIGGCTVCIIEEETK